MEGYNLSIVYVQAEDDIEYKYEPVPVTGSVKE